jgi:rubredoxin
VIRGYDSYKNKFLEKLNRQGMFELIDDYVDSKTEVSFKCKVCGYVFKLRPDRVFYKRCCQNCINRKILYKYEEHKFNFIQKLEENGNFELISEYVGCCGRPMRFRCLKCNFEFETTYKEGLRKKYCPKCLKVACRVGENNKKSIALTNPELMKNLVNKEDAENYSGFSKGKLVWKCPDCGTKIKRSPASFSKGFKCKVCSDGISYPNKFFASFLKEINVDYEPEKVFDWSNFGSGYCFKYDFFIQSKNMIIEVMGRQHYPFEGLFFHQTYNDIYENDIKKEKLAKSNGIENYIKIDCRDTHFEFMKKSIIKEMTKFFNIKDLDWNKIKKRSLKSKIVEVCKYYNKHKQVGTSELAKIFNTNAGTIWKYLKAGQDCGICNYTIEDSHRREISNRWKSIKKNKKHDFELISNYYDKNNKETINNLAKIFNMDEKRIRKCLLLGDKHNICIFPEHKNLENKILKFSLDGVFIKSFNTLAEAAKELGVTESAVSLACRKKNLICKDYIFRNNKR